LRWINLGGLEDIHTGDQRPGTDGLRYTIRLALMHDGIQGDRKEAASALLHLVDEVSHLQEVSLRAVELPISTAKRGNIRWVPGLERRHQFGQELGTANDRIVDLALLDPSLLKVSVALLLHDLVDLRCQCSRIPHGQFFVASCMSQAYQPHGGSR